MKFYFKLRFIWTFITYAFYPHFLKLGTQFVMYYKLRCNSTQFVIYYKLRNYYKLQRNNAYQYTAMRDCILTPEFMKIRIPFWMLCIQISVTFINQTISTSIICVSVLVSSLINIQEQNVINTFHVRVQQVNRGSYVYWRTSLIPQSWRYPENHILRLNSCPYLSIRSWEALLVLNKILESWLNIREISVLKLLSLKSC